MSIREQYVGWRNRFIANPKVQDFLATFPLTRGFAQKPMREIFDVTMGFVYSQILLACVELDIFKILKDGPLSVENLATRIDMPVDGTDRLARAAASLKLLEKMGEGRFALGERGAALLGNPSVFEMIKHHKLFYRDLTDPVELLRARSSNTHLAKFWNYSPDSNIDQHQNEMAQSYSALMAETQAFIVSEVLHAYSFSRHSHLMDVGGGNGAFLSAVGASAPDLKLTLCDLPQVVPLARERFEAEGLSRRANAVACDFHEGLPNVGADAVSLIRVLHDHDDHDVEALLASIRSILPPGGSIIIAEPMAETHSGQAMGDGYFGLYLWAMGRGRPRSSNEISILLEKAGFRRVSQVKTRRPLLTQLMVAQ